MSGRDGITLPGVALAFGGAGFAAAGIAGLGGDGAADVAWKLGTNGFSWLIGASAITGTATPNATAISDRSIALPVGPHLGPGDAEYVASTVLEKIAMVAA